MSLIELILNSSVEHLSYSLRFFGVRAFLSRWGTTYCMGVGNSEEINRGYSGGVGFTERFGGISHEYGGSENTEVSLEAHGLYFC